MKKVFIISSVLLCLAASFYLVYNLFILEDVENKTALQKIIKNNNDSKQSSSDKIARIINGNVKNISLNKEGEKIQYYNNEEKGFWITSFDGTIKNKLSNDNFTDLKQIIWSQNKEKAILEIGDSFYGYSFGEKEKIIKKSKALNWINFNQNILYTYTDSKTGKKTLNIANPDGNAWKELSVIESDDINIAFIPGSAKSSFWAKPDAFKESNIAVVSMGEVELNKLGELKFGADYLWSNDGNKFLRSSVAQKGGNNLILESCEVKTGKCVNLNLPTMASKCVWSKNNKNIYCAAPINIDKNTIMPNDYLNNKFFTKDFFWKINAESFRKEKIIDEKYIKEDLDATNMIVSPNENFLFFINKRDGGLFRIIIG